MRESLQVQNQVYGKQSETFAETVKEICRLRRDCLQQRTEGKEEKEMKRMMWEFADVGEKRYFALPIDFRFALTEPSGSNGPNDFRKERKVFGIFPAGETRAYRAERRRDERRTRGEVFGGDGQDK
mmetsp:Transcript_46659/g.92113  ORF Transcript_46659/g.92113 Transcript_46659/m.92113 type:complete len:126 (-) Transcript_46659:455-832(-)